MNKELLTQLLLPSLLGVSLFITIVPEIRNFGILFFAVGSFAWFFLLIKKLKLLTHDEGIDNLLKYFIYPSIIINILMLIFSEDYRNAGAGWVYLILSIFTVLIYLTPQFRNSVVGIDHKLTKGISWGVGIAFSFLFISKILPGFSLLVPELPFSLLGGVRMIVIVGFAPIFESSGFRGGLLNAIMSTYHLPFGISNVIQATAFAIYHFLAYGILLSSLSTLTQLFGATTAIAGSLITALVFGLIMGYLVKKYGLIVELVSHPIINGFLFFTVLSVGTFFSIS